MLQLRVVETVAPAEPPPSGPETEEPPDYRSTGAPGHNGAVGDGSGTIWQVAELSMTDLLLPGYVTWGNHGGGGSREGRGDNLQSSSPNVQIPLPILVVTNVPPPGYPAHDPPKLPSPVLPVPGNFTPINLDRHHQRSRSVYEVRAAMLEPATGTGTSLFNLWLLMVREAP